MQSFRRDLLRWYRKAGRELPWRNTRDPYRVWISEVMLQQTTVAAVRPYFERFLTRFPTLADLAAADEQELLRYWEGLGYYSRARNLHRAARVLVADHGSQFPRDVPGLMALPGIGRYTAGAIASFAFDLPAPILEANTLRVYCRLLGWREDPRRAMGQRRLWQFAQELLPGNSPGVFNQALMDLGAIVCVLPLPNCAECPVTRFCRAKAAGLEAEIPPAQARPAITHVTEYALLVRHRGKILLRQRSKPERWAGLWDFLRFSLDDEPKQIAATGSEAEQLARKAASLFGTDVDVGDEWTSLTHGVTRFRILLRGFWAAWRSPQPLPDRNHYRWVLPRDLDKFPLSTSARTLAQRLVQTEATFEKHA